MVTAKWWNNYHVTDTIKSSTDTIGRYDKF